VEIQHREMIACAVVRQTQALHEDFAIVSIHPLPHNAMQFGPVREVIREFLEDHMGARVRDIQPTHLGQALLQFVHNYDRDSLVNNSPHPYDDVEFSLVRHNQGINWRAMNFNRECWLMLMGFPLNYWNNEAIQSALASFGRVILWKNDRSHLARLIVRARVTELEDVPYFILITEGEEFHGESWTVQCKILGQQLLGVQPVDEEPISLLPINGLPPLFDFIGLGQPG
jgi:hypothetical protein